MRIVVVGAGMASVRLVEELVARGVHGITVVGAERYVPYNRILLSAVLEGTHRPGALDLRSRSWFRAQGVELHLGRRVLTVDAEARLVRVDGGRELSYDRLVLATGSRPALPPIRGLTDVGGRLHQRAFAFHTREDCRRLMEAVPTARRAVVVGGGLLGVQVARALTVRGLDTEIVESGTHLLHGRVDSTAGLVLKRSLTRLGTHVHTDARAVRLSAAGLHLDGQVLESDLVVVTAGSRPAVDLARRAGLEVGRGVLVDNRLQTSDADIHAIGDCAEHTGRQGLPLNGLVAPAWEQAEVLAAHLAGEETAYTGTRTIARLRAADLEVAVLGDPEHTEGEVVEVTNPFAGTHRRLVVRDGSIVAGTLIGDLSRVGAIGRAFEQATELGPHEPGALLLPEATAPVRPELTDDTEVCACAGVSAGRIRACSSIEEVRERTRATTGCGGCASVVTALLTATGTQLLKGTA